VIDVDDPTDARLAPFALSDRQLRAQGDGGHGWFLAEGDLVVERALNAGCRPVAALVDAARVPAVTDGLAAAGTPVYAAGEDVRRAATRLGVIQPVLALFERPAPCDAAELVARTDRVVVVQAVDNPANVGAIVRNAAGLGWGGLVLDRESADPFARRALRVAMGTAFALPHARVADVEAFAAGLGDMTTYALTPAPDADDLAAVPVPARLAVVVGSERDGLTCGVLRACDRRVRIPLAPGVDSLNVAAATAIACHQLRPSEVLPR
jgi:tRNA G18 (ribose-2'-O)-methylase SpoU